MNTDQILQSAIDQVIQSHQDYPGVIIIHDLRSLKVAWMSDLGLKLLGKSLNEIRELTNEEYHATYFNTEDSNDYVPKLFELFHKNDMGEFVSYLQQVRFRPNGSWSWHFTSTKILCRDENGHPLANLSMSYPVESMQQISAKASRILEENNFLRKNFHLYKNLSKRECEILRDMVLGISAGDSAIKLFISSHTVETHRKNIKKKLKTSSFAELSQYARAFDLI